MLKSYEKQLIEGLSEKNQKRLINVVNGITRIISENDREPIRLKNFGE